MKKLVPVALCLAVAGAWWLRRELAPAAALPASETTAAAVPVNVPATRLEVPAPTATEIAATAPSLAEKKLSLKDDALRARLDENIPSRLYAEAARCYKGGGHPDERIDVSYRISVADGAVSFSNLSVTNSTLSDRALERCIKDRILSAKWRDEELPDLDEEDDLFMRVYNFQKFAANDDAPASPTRN
jgi:hypothetical protein